jgi:hypothetical protein
LLIFLFLLLSFNWPPLSSLVTGRLTGSDTLRWRRLHKGLTDSRLCRRCEAHDETSAHVLCRCEALTTQTSRLGAFKPRDILELY